MVKNGQEWSYKGHLYRDIHLYTDFIILEIIGFQTIVILSCCFDTLRAHSYYLSAVESPLEW